MTPHDIEFIASVLKQRSGLIIGADKAYLVESRLSPLARREGYQNVEALIASMRTRKDESLLAQVTDAMTTNETLFFRDRLPFDQFGEIVLPTLTKSRAMHDLKILSAACSTGQEPYSLAMQMEELRPQFPRVSLNIHAIDISKRCLEKASSGLYTQFEVQRGLPITFLVRYFTKTDENWRLNAKLRSMVKFSAYNLLDDLRNLGRQDIIFLRNVLIYFDIETKKRILENMANLLAPDGFLFLGSTETVLGVTEVFKPVPGHRGLYSRNVESRLQGAKLNTA
jgi:chemotaxis protein methyltransferase CheR